MFPDGLTTPYERTRRVLEKLAPTLRRMPNRVMITGHTERYRVEAARDAGVTEILAKPITAHNLFARITEILERPRAFVRCDGYFGPDRRRRQEADMYGGPWRRADDLQAAEVR